MVMGILLDLFYRVRNECDTNSTDIYFMNWTQSVSVGRIGIAIKSIQMN